MFSLRAPSCDSRAKSDGFRAARAPGAAEGQPSDISLIILATVLDGTAVESLSRVACRVSAASRRPSYDDLFIAVGARG